MGMIEMKGINKGYLLGEEKRGMKHQEAEERCLETIRLLGLDQRVEHRPNELSGGQKQRVSIARAVIFVLKCV